MTRFWGRVVAVALLSVPFQGRATELNSEQLYEKFKSAVVRVLGWTPGGLEGVYLAYASIAAHLLQMPTAGDPIVTAPMASESMNDKLVDQKCPSPRENFQIIGVGYENETLTIALVDRRKVDILSRNGVKQ